MERHAPEHARAFRDFGAVQPVPQLPALDGLRGLAVVAVVAFHGHWGWARGGFLGVSLFFTLSGFLITSLLLDEHRRTGTVDLVAFWGRRVRRLLPAAWLTLAVVTVVALALGTFGRSDRLDVWASLASVANWRFWATGNSYGQLFAEPSPVRHFWSLAIEEQIYLALPLVLAAVLAVAARRNRTVTSAGFIGHTGVTATIRAVGITLGVLWAGSVLSTLLQSDFDRVYYGTDTRASELLVGALLALAVARPGLRHRLVDDRWTRGWVQAAGAVALVTSLVAWVTVDVSNPVVSDGGLVVMGMVSAVVVLGAAVGVGPVATMMSGAPLRYLGRISYGVYLFHWPLLVFVTERRTGLSHPVRFVLAVAVAVALAAVSHRWFEFPMRRGMGIGRIGVARLAPIAAVALVGMTFVGSDERRRLPGFDAEAAAADLRRLSDERPGAAGGTSVPSATSPSATSPSATAPTTTAPLRPPTFAVFGDSVALSLAYPASAWARTTGAATFVGGDAELGCGIGRGGRQRAFGDTERTATCDAWPARWRAFGESHPLDLAVVQTGQWELVDRRLAGDTTWRSIGDPVYDEYLRTELLAATDVLSERGALVVWVTLPHYSRLDEDALPEAMRISHDPVRVDRLNRIIGEVAAARPDTVRVADLATWMEGRIDDVSLRQDGSHFNTEGAGAVATEFLGPRLTEIWRNAEVAGG